MKSVRRFEWFNRFENGITYDVLSGSLKKKKSRERNLNSIWEFSVIKIETLVQKFTWFFSHFQSSSSRIHFVSNTCIYAKQVRKKKKAQIKSTNLLAKPSLYLKDTLSSVHIFNQELRDTLKHEIRWGKVSEEEEEEERQKGKKKKRWIPFSLVDDEKKRKKKKIERIDNFLTRRCIALPWGWEKDKLQSPLRRGVLVKKRELKSKSAILGASGKRVEALQIRGVASYSPIYETNVDTGD